MDRLNRKNEKNEKNERAISISGFLFLVLDVLLFGTLGAIFGIIVNALFPRVKIGEPIGRTIVFLALQLIVSATVITAVVKITPILLSREADDLGGLTVFGILFFAAQGKFRFRLNKITRDLFRSKGSIDKVKEENLEEFREIIND